MFNQQSEPLIDQRKMINNKYDNNLIQNINPLKFKSL